MQHSDFMPHGICYLWKPELVWLHVISDGVIALAYYAIPPALLYLVVRARREARALGLPQPARGLPYEWVYLAFGLFIVACGTTHVMGVWNVWNPNYWVSGGVKVVTALASVATAVALPPLMPRAIALFREARISELQHTQLSQLAAIVEHSDDAIITQDLRGTVMTWNHGATRLYGYETQEIIGKPIATLLPDDRKNEVADILDRIARGESVTHHETVRVRKDGTPVDISLTVSPVRNASGQIVAASAIARDIGHFKLVREREVRLAEEKAARSEAERLAQRMEALADEQRNLYEQAAAVSRTKSEFLAVMSHELRTPLNAILGYSDILQAGVFGDLSTQQSEKLTRIQRSAHHLSQLIEQILIHAKLEAGKEQPNFSRVALNDLIQETTELIQPAAQEKQIEIAYDLPEPVIIETDATFLKQILLNLLSNAVKFTDHGTVRIAASVDVDKLTLEVQDSGRGIAAEHLDRIYDPFWQAEQGRTRGAEGTGLGLTVARRLAVMLGGDIQVVSEPGVGSTFRLVVPATRGHA